MPSVTDRLVARYTNLVSVVSYLTAQSSASLHLCKEKHLGLSKSPRTCWRLVKKRAPSNASRHALQRLNTTPTNREKIKTMFGCTAQSSLHWRRGWFPITRRSGDH